MRWFLLLILASWPIPSCLAAWQDPDLAAFARAFDSRKVSERKRALTLLEGRPGVAATLALLPALGDEATEVRQRARDLLGERRGPDELEAVARTGLRAGNPLVRIHCAEALAAASDVDGIPAATLLRSLRDPENRVREAVATALGLRGDERHRSTVVSSLRRERDPRVRAALLEALGRIHREAAMEEARRVLRSDDDGPPAVAALAVLSVDGSEAGRHAARRLLGHRAWEARVAAARWLGEDRGDAREAAAALLSAMRSEKRLRVATILGEQLERLTGAPFGTRVDRWEEWWEQHGHRFEPPDRPPVRRKRGGSSARFYDIPLDSDRIAFVLDTSRSMRDAARPGGTASKMELAIARTAATLASLRDRTALNVVSFGTTVTAWKPRLVPATLGARGDALRFLQKRPLQGRTNLFDAIAVALDDPAVDTVCVLTDGAPTAGEETSRRGFLAGLRRLRRWRPVRVHCVEVGGNTTGRRWRGFLAEVAAECGGVHVAR
ncbi:MAG: HEAT repeat domain-containing protein [Planctomycetota bacterium]|jgi:HEAT repeat protein